MYNNEKEVILLKKITNPLTGRKIEDLKNKKFVRLQVLDLDIKKTEQYNRIYWLCKCDCGNIVSVSKGSLYSGKSKSCGCYKKEETKKARFNDLTGKRFGKLLVVKYLGYNKNNRSTWLCRCDCGNEKEVLQNSLVTEKTKSCGCLFKEEIRKRQTKDLSNKKFSRLTAIKIVGYNKYNTAIWECVCECGNIKNYASTTLLNGSATSCGCLKKEKSRATKLSHIKIGDKFGRLTIKEMCIIDGLTYWKCLCECGQETTVYTSALTSKNTKSCGCLHKEVISGYKENLVGEKFGFLTVKKYLTSVKDKHHSSSLWECLCDCGKTKKVITYHLKSGMVKTCGCNLSRKGINNPNWKGGVSPLHIRIREAIAQWRIDSLRNGRYRCCLTGAKGSEIVVHHVNKQFNEILEEAISKLDIQKNYLTGDYSLEEMEELKKEVVQLHYKYGLGIVLHKDLHRMFHSLYGKTNTTKEQFEEFKELYKNGKLDLMTMEKDCS